MSLLVWIAIGVGVWIAALIMASSLGGASKRGDRISDERRTIEARTARQTTQLPDVLRVVGGGRRGPECPAEKTRVL
jgi:hypothetical protein